MSGTEEGNLGASTAAAAGDTSRLASAAGWVESPSAQVHSLVAAVAGTQGSSTDSEEPDSTVATR